MRKIIFIAVVLMSMFCGAINAQNVQLKGHTFTEVNDSVVEQKTHYTFVDKKGVEHAIYLSKGGKAYIKMVSKKTGKPYRRYLPEVTEKIGKPTVKK